MKQLRLIWIFIFIIGGVIRSTELLHPIDTGSWRESDLSSIARNYYRNGMDFFHPQIDWGGKGPGYTESEFPVYPYLIALSYKLFGVWEPTGRIISFLFSLGTMIIFFILCRYLFDPKTAIAVSFFFTLSPLLIIISNSIQPESMMFFFYISAAYTFIRWIDSQSKRYYISTLIFTALALLCKLTAVNLGILFILIIIIKKGWKYLFKPKVILLGILSVIPSIIWYTYSHRIYLHYGNSLGISNEYAWVGIDFFTNPYFIKGIIRQELINVWTFSGLFIILLAIIGTKIIRTQSIIFPTCWLVAAATFYFITARTTADDWAYYYHIFSVPSASMLLGISVIALYDKYFPKMKFRFKPIRIVSENVKSGLVISLLSFSVLLYTASSLKYLIRTKPSVFAKSGFYECKNDLSNLIPKGSLILASGYHCHDEWKYTVAYNSSYFFYWLDLKGYNICIQDQSIDNVIAFKEMGAKFYIAEVSAMQLMQGFEEEMRGKFKTLLECNGIVLFEL